MITLFCYKQMMPIVIDKENGDFGAISRSYEKAAVAVLPVPLDATVSYGRGTAKGPNAIIQASPNAEVYDFPTGRDYEKMKLATLSPLDTKGSVEEVMERVESRVAGILADGKHPFIIGGEHSITGPAVRAVAKHFSGIVGVVQIDAHADLRESYSGTIHSHASVMARVREIAPALQLGIRSCSREEARRIESEGLPVLSPAESLREETVREHLSRLPEQVYLTVDIDAMDPSIMPATGTPEPGGFSWEEINRLIDMVADMKKIVAADLTEFAPIEGMRAPDFIAARLAFNILAAFPDIME